jgi:hypothetical protein
LIFGLIVHLIKHWFFVKKKRESRIWLSNVECLLFELYLLHIKCDIENFSSHSNVSFIPPIFLCCSWINISERVFWIFFCLEHANSNSNSANMPKHLPYAKLKLGPKHDEAQSASALLNSLRSSAFSNGRQWLTFTTNHDSPAVFRQPLMVRTSSH